VELKSCTEINFNWQLLSYLRFLFDNPSEFSQFGNGISRGLECLFKGRLFGDSVDSAVLSGEQLAEEHGVLAVEQVVVHCRTGFGFLIDSKYLYKRETPHDLHHLILVVGITTTIDPRLLLLLVNVGS